jgi:hypothetical protein
MRIKGSPLPRRSNCCEVTSVNRCQIVKRLCQTPICLVRLTRLRLSYGVAGRTAYNYLAKELAGRISARASRMLALPLFRAREGVLFRSGFSERFVVGREINRVDAVAFGIAVKKIAFAQFEFSFYSAQSLQFSCVSGTTLF